MKIFILAEVFFPDKIGGAGKYAYHLAKCLANKGNDVSVATRKSGNLVFEETIEGIKVFRVNWPDGPNPLKPILFLKEMHRLFYNLSLKNKFDLLIFNQPLSAFSIALSKKAKTIPKVYNFYSSWADEFEIKSLLKHKPYSIFTIFKKIFLFPIIFLMRIIEKTVILKSDNIVTISQYTKNRLQHLYALPEEKIEIIYPGVDTHKFTPTDSQQKNLLRTELGIENSNFVLFTARNLVPRMGLDDLIIAFSSLANKKSNLKLFIAGGGFLEKDLMIISSRLNLESKIKFLGGLAEDELVKYYQSADLFILPTRFLEGFGIATIEALACGLPVLATPVGGTIEVLGKFDKNLLFSDSNAESMASKILEFIETKTDRRILAKHCRDFVLENYSLEKFSDHTGKFYRTISEKHG